MSKQVTANGLAISHMLAEVESLVDAQRDMKGR
jgi:hypothetical protein